MIKPIIKNLICFAVVAMILPVSPVAAESDSNENIIVNEINKKPSVLVKASYTGMKNVIDEFKPKLIPTLFQKTNSIAGNSRDWTKSKYTEAQIKEMICQVFRSNCHDALVIAKAESGYRPWVISRTNDYGVFQLNCRWQKRRAGGDCNKFLDPAINIKVAKQIYDEQGWNPWTTKIYLNR